MWKRSLSLILFFLLSCCRPEKIDIVRNAEGVVTQMPFIWKSSISDGVLGYGLYHGYIVDGKGIVCISMRKSTDPKKYGEFYMQLKDVDTGKDIWTWDDFFNKILGSTLNQSILLQNGKMLIHDLNSDYCIDTGTGKTIWKSQRGFGSAMEPTHLGDKYFISGNPPAMRDQYRVQDALYVGDFNTGRLVEKLRPQYSEEFAKKIGDWYYVGTLYRFLTFNNGTDEMLLLPYEEPGPVGRFNDQRTFFGLYNLTREEWVYERIPVSVAEDGGNASLMPIMNGEKVHLTSLNRVFCFDWRTGKKIWERKLTEIHTGPDDMILVGNRLVLNFHNATMYCVDAQTGQMLWSQKSSAMSSDLYHQDGIVYWIRDKNLQALDIETGHILWDMPSLDRKEEKRSDSWYGGFVTGLPGKNGQKGRIYATTNLNLYCFEAIR